jgi:hypothetical protein
MADMVLVPFAPETGIPLPFPPVNLFPGWMVPPGADELTVDARSTVPLTFDLAANFGNPDVWAVSAGTTASVTVKAPEIASGLWFAAPEEIGPFPAGGGPAATADMGAKVRTRQFDPAVTSSTGDIWLGSVMASPPPATPLTLPPGGSGTITVTITPQAPRGSVVRGVVYVDDFSGYTGSGDELIGIPYSYTVG